MTVDDIRQTWIGRSMTAHTLCDPALYETANQNCVIYIQNLSRSQAHSKKKEEKKASLRTRLIQNVTHTKM